MDKNHMWIRTICGKFYVYDTENDLVVTWITKENRRKAKRFTREQSPLEIKKLERATDLKLQAIPHVVI